MKLVQAHGSSRVSTNRCNYISMKSTSTQNIGYLLWWLCLNKQYQYNTLSNISHRPLLFRKWYGLATKQSDNFSVCWFLWYLCAAVWYKLYKLFYAFIRKFNEMRDVEVELKVNKKKERPKHKTHTHTHIVLSLGYFRYDIVSMWIISCGLNVLVGSGVFRFG